MQAGAYAEILHHGGEKKSSNENPSLFAVTLNKLMIQNKQTGDGRGGELLKHEIISFDFVK